MDYKSPNTAAVSILVDLDDTIFGTSKHIIAPWDDLWTSQSSVFLSESEVRRFSAQLSLLRSSAPRSIDRWICKTFPRDADDLFQLRDNIDKIALLRGIQLESGVVSALFALKTLAPVIIVTQGDVGFQSTKIDLLDLPSIVDDCRICDTQKGEQKIDSFARIAFERKTKLIVIGNRLDNEILAGNQLGATTIWVRQGEGEAATPSSLEENPTFQVRRFEEVVPIVKRILDEPLAGLKA